MMSAASEPPPSMKSNLGSGSLASGAPGAGAVIRPQPVTEKSLMESVAGFINEVQAIHQTHLGAHPPHNDPRIHVTWARFEATDLNDLRLWPDGSDVNGNAPPLLLILGYTQGVQIWLVPFNGEAKEVLSWKQGSVKTLRVLSHPENSFGSPDNFAHCRPLIAMADSTGPGTAFSSASFLSLKTGEQVHNIKFNSEIADITANRRVLVISFREKFAVFDACSLDARFTITSCYPSPGVHSNPISLGDRWLAYADQKLVPIHRSFGGMECDGSQSVAAWSINVGSKLAQGVSKIYSNFFSGNASPCSSAPSSYSGGRTYAGSSPNTGGRETGTPNESQQGVVTILDVVTVGKTQSDEVNIGNKIEGVVAHFIAHNKAIVALQFDSSGSLLLTSDKNGNYFNLFRAVPHPAGACYSAVHHLYSLYRGDTPGSVQDIAFSADTRWVAVSTLRGTTHIFPITPYGGPVGVRTHTSARVVNKLSRFHRSAGFDDYRTSTTGSTSSGRTSPNPNGSGNSPLGSSLSKMSFLETVANASGNSAPLIIPYPNPHIPPFPSPAVVQPVAQLRQPYIVSLTNQTIGSATSVGRKKNSGSSHQSAEDVPIRLACKFGPSRAWLVGAQHNMFNRRQHQRQHDALYVMANHGVLLEYSLDAIPDTTLPKEKICESSPIELVVTPYGQWSLTQPRDKADLQPPLPIDNPLMLPTANHYSFGKSIANEDENEDKWLSQVEIITHFGPHRRLWMGPQFCFKTLQPANDGQEGNVVQDLDISLPARPEQSNPVNMPTATKNPGHAGKNPVLIEAGSASSFEWSPHFSNAFQRHPGHAPPGGQLAKETILDVESELQEAMSETVGEESLLDGTNPTPTPSSSVNASRRTSDRAAHRTKTESSEEEFFCLTPEDGRSLGGGGRSRNSSTTQHSQHPLHVNTIHDTKIFSVAVESRKSEATKMDGMKVCDVDSGFSGRFAVVSRDQRKAKREPTVALEPPMLEPTKVKAPEPSSESEKKPSKGGKKKKNKNKNGAKSASASSADEYQVEEVPFAEPRKSLKSAKVREITPPNHELVESFHAQEEELKEALAETTTEVDLMSASNIKTEELSTHSDEFQEITNRQALDDTDPEDMDEEARFCPKEEDQEDLDASDSGSHKFHIDPETSAKPSVPSWVDDLLKNSTTDNPILKGIENAEKKYDKKKMSQSTGFSVDFAQRSNSQPAILANTESVDSSEDDMEFRPATSGRKKRKSQQPPLKSSLSYSGSFRSRGSSFADSESSFKGEEEAEARREKEQPDGWSFEADDLDVTKLITEATVVKESEKPQLDDVFKFDSEMAVEDTDEADEGVASDSDKLSFADKLKFNLARHSSKPEASVSLEDLKDALEDEEDDDEEEEDTPASGNKMT
eukprot:maker-scaffold12_size759060-snap-gene-2.15 protein:Tk05566 transcript:maker-scaffold12_size759060-snap-gene-2.15-mRNA-1 annotation:"breast carcinoma-amplified sequence 3-like protein"